MKVDWVPLGSVLEINRRPITIEADGFYRRIGIYSWGRGMLRREPASSADMGSMKYFTFPQPSLIFSNIQAWEGAVALAGPSDEGYVCSSRFYPYVPRPNSDANLGYLHEFFRSERGLTIMRRASPGTQVRNKVLSRSILERSAVPLPTRTEQVRIAAHLSRLSTIAHPKPKLGLSEVREQVFRSLTANGASTRKLREIVRPRQPEAVLADKAYPIGGVFGFARGIIHRPTLRGSDTKYQTLTLALEHDIVYSKLKAFEGAVAVIRAQDSGRYFSPEFPVFEPTATDVRPGYLEQVLLSPPILRALAEQSTGVGARRERVHPAKFLELEVPIPTPAEQESVSDLCRRVAESEALARRSERLAAAILPAARNEIFNSMR